MSCLQFHRDGFIPAHTMSMGGGISMEPVDPEEDLCPEFTQAQWKSHSSISSIDSRRLVAGVDQWCKHHWHQLVQMSFVRGLVGFGEGWDRVFGGFNLSNLPANKKSWMRGVSQSWVNEPRGLVVAPTLVGFFSHVRKPGEIPTRNQKWR